MAEEENTRKSTRKAKMVARETISNAISSSNQTPRRRDRRPSDDEEEEELMPPPPRQKKRGGAQANSVNLMGGKSLFTIISNARADMQSTASDWVELYKSDRDAGLLQMFQFFIQSSGCKGELDEEMQANLEFAEIIRKMTEQFDEDSAEYPLIVSGQQYKKFRANLADFIQQVVKLCQSSLVYDGYLIDNLSSFLTGLTDSQVRAFRHTSTLLTMKLMTAIVDIAVSVEKAKENARKQLEVERQKHQSKKAGERLTALEHKKQELDQNHTELLNMLTFIFRGVFVFRYRDVVPDIRAICMQELGLWITKLPSLYLEDSFLKYLGWTLFDKVADVRLVCVKAITSLYDMEEGYEAKLELFTHRFKDRIVEMTLDKDYEVAVAAVKLILSITKTNSSVVSMRDAENVYELVFSSNRGVAQAAAEFLNYKMIDGAEQDDPNMTRRTSRGGIGAEPTASHNKLRTLVQFFHESQLHDHATYLVDSLWEATPILRDWAAMTDLLLDENMTREDPLNQEQEARLIDVMVCCVRQASTGEYPAGRGTAHRKLTGKEAKQARDDKFELTEHFIETLPHLLSKYGSDVENVNHLLKVATHFDLEVYTTSRKDKHLQALLKMLRDIVEKQSDFTTIETCIEVFGYLCNENYSISAKVELAKSSLADSLITKYKNAWLQCIEEGDSSEKAMYALYSATKKLWAFSTIHPIHTTSIIDIWESVIRPLKRASKIPDEIVAAMMNIASNTLMWLLHSLDNANPDKAELKSLKKKVSSFMNILRDLLLSGHAVTLAETFTTVCDLLVVFSRQLAVLYSSLEPLVYEADEQLQQQLCSFLTEYIFTADDTSMDAADDNEKIDEMHNKRRRLAAFCKLITCRVIPISNATEIFKNYVKFYSDYGDIIKYTLNKCREISKTTTAQTLTNALAKLYEEVAEDNGGVVEVGSEGFQTIKDLARRFSLTFGFDNAKNRDALAALHQQGIVFALRRHPLGGLNIPPNLTFLDIMCEFITRLLRQDKRSIGQYLDRHLAHLPPHKGEGWASLNNYRGLLFNDDDTRSVASTSVTKSRRGRSSAASAASAATNRTPANRGGAPFTSTALKKRAHDDDDVVSVSASISALSTGSDKGSDSLNPRLMSSIISEEGEDVMLSSQARRRNQHRVKLAAPSELLPEGAEGADASDLEEFLME